MSEAFGFMFAFYGLLLGLAVAEVAGGFSRAYDERHTRSLGVVAPLFGILLLVDLITFWMNAWAYRELAEVSYLVAYAVAVVALLYYFAATQVFPKAARDSNPRRPYHEPPARSCLLRARQQPAHPDSAGNIRIHHAVASLQHCALGRPET